MGVFFKHDPVGKPLGQWLVAARTRKIPAYRIRRKQIGHNNEDERPFEPQISNTLTVNASNMTTINKLIEKKKNFII